MSSTPVASEFDICCTSFFKKLTELSGILKDPVGIPVQFQAMNCQIYPHFFFSSTYQREK